MEFDPDAYRERLSIAASHRLILKDSRIRYARHLARQSYLLRETDPQDKLVAHYRVWMHYSSKPPFREQHGWEKYAPDGSLLDREVRYTEQAADARLH